MKTQKQLYFSSLNGIRFISFTWVMVHHVYQFVTEKMAVQNVNQFNTELQDGFLFRPVLNILASDTFFFVSGLVMAYTILKELEKTKRYWYCRRNISKPYSRSNYKEDDRG